MARTIISEKQYEELGKYEDGKPRWMNGGPLASLVSRALIHRNGSDDFYAITDAGRAALARFRETNLTSSTSADFSKVALGLINHPQTKLEISASARVGGKPDNDETAEILAAVRDALARFGHTIVVELEGTTSTCIHGRWDTQDCAHCEEYLDGCATRARSTDTSVRRLDNASVYREQQLHERELS